jgi:hypothetical protein
MCMFAVAGNVNITELRAKAEEHSKNLAALMITYPSTHGVYEDGVDEICRIIHQHGGQVRGQGSCPPPAFESAAAPSCRQAHSAAQPASHVLLVPSALAGRWSAREALHPRAPAVSKPGVVPRPPRPPPPQVYMDGANMNAQVRSAARPGSSKSRAFFL